MDVSQFAAQRIRTNGGEAAWGHDLGSEAPCSKPVALRFKASDAHYVLCANLLLEGNSS
jgi:hypothetical protein